MATKNSELLELPAPEFADRLQAVLEAPAGQYYRRGGPFRKVDVAARTMEALNALRPRLLVEDSADFSPERRELLLRRVEEMLTALAKPVLWGKAAPRHAGAGRHPLEELGDDDFLGEILRWLGSDAARFDLLLRGVFALPANNKRSLKAVQDFLRRLRTSRGAQAQPLIERAVAAQGYLQQQRPRRRRVHVPEPHERDLAEIQRLEALDDQAFAGELSQWIEAGNSSTGYRVFLSYPTVYRSIGVLVRLRDEARRKRRQAQGSRPRNPDRVRNLQDRVERLRETTVNADRILKELKRRRLAENRRRPPGVQKQARRLIMELHPDLAQQLLGQMSRGRAGRTMSIRAHRDYSAIRRALKQAHNEGREVDGQSLLAELQARQ